MKFKNQTLVGFTSQNTPVHFPIYMEDFDFNIWFNDFSLIDRTDVFCMTEFLYHRFSKRNDISSTSQSTQKVFDKIYEKFSIGEFQVQLTFLALETSIDRIKYGKKPFSRDVSRLI